MHKSIYIHKQTERAEGNNQETPPRGRRGE